MSEVAANHTTRSPMQFGFDFPDKAGIIMLIGPSRAGKSHFLKSYIIDKCVNRKYFQFGLACLGTYFTDGYDYLPEKAIMKGYDEEMLEEYITGLQNHEKETGEKPAPNFLVLDDVMGLLTDQSSFFTFLATTYRHTNTTIIIGIQFANKLNTVLKSNTSIAVMFNGKTERYIKGLYQSFGQLFDNEKEFKKYYINHTKERYTAIVFDESENELENNYKVVKAPAKLPPVKLEF